MTVAPVTRPERDLEGDLEAELLATLVQLFESARHNVVADAVAVLADPTIEVLAPETTSRRTARRQIPREEKPWSAWRVRIVFLLSFVSVSVPIFALMTVVLEALQSGTRSGGGDR